MGRGVGVWSGKVTLEKIIAYHERESWLGSYTDNAPRAKFHESVVRLLKKLQQETAQEKN